MEPLDAAAWWRLWAMAGLAHLFGRPVESWGWEVVAALGVGLAAIVVLLADSARARTGLLLAVLLSVWVEAPLIGNHWLLAGFVSLVALVARPWSDDWLARAAPGMRAVLLTFYSFAAFAKLNTGFFDASASCARFFANQSLRFWQLPEIASDSPLTRAAIVASVIIELSVPLLLLLRPTRRVGILLAVFFHLFLALDLGQHFFDFTMVLVPLFLLFAPAGVLHRVGTALGGPRSWEQARWVVPLVSMVVAFSLPVPLAFKGMAILASWVLWIVMTLAIVWVLTKIKWGSEQLRWTMGPMVLLVVSITALNGLAPYLELKTATGFNMYSNLVTGGGETNHLIVPATAELRSGQDDLAIITATNDDDLAAYIDSGFALPMVNLRDYLAEHPETAVTFERGGEDILIERAGDHPDLLASQPLLQEKFAFLRAVPLDDPPACQNSWLPAR